MSTLIKVSLIVRDGGTQPRAGLAEETVQEYQEARRAGAAFPPVVVFHDGKRHWLADGFHRCEAWERDGIGEIDADVRQGGQRDAVLYSVGANADHGLPRTNADKRRAVLRLLADPEWVKWSNVQIAKATRTSHTFVAKLRPEAQPETLQVETRIGADGKERRLPQRAAEPAPAPPQAQPARRGGYESLLGGEEGDALAGKPVAVRAVAQPDPDPPAPVHAPPRLATEPATKTGAKLTEILTLSAARNRWAKVLCDLIADCAPEHRQHLRTILEEKAKEL